MSYYDRMSPDANANKLKQDPRRADFRLFLFLHVAAWILIPCLSRRITHYDSSEALAWGLTWEWGTNKHPPLSGWLAEGAFRLLGETDLAVYALGALCSALALIFIRRLALEFLDSEAAFFSAVFLEGVIYYNFCVTEFNVNVLSLALVPAAVYFCRRAVQTGSYGFWLASGLAGGLALLTKYTNGLVALALGVYLVFTLQGRSRLKTPGPWLAALVAVLLFLPHFLWLARYDFSPLRYSQDKAAAALSLAGRVLEPLRLLLAQAANSAAALGLWAWLYSRTPPAGRGPRRRPEPFLFCAGVLPLFFMLLLAAILGLRGSTKWAYAFIGYPPLLLFYCLPAKITPQAGRRALILAYVVLLAFGAGTLVKNLGFTAATTSVDGRALAAVLKAAWDKETARPLVYAGGATHLVSRVSSYLPERPRPLWSLDRQVTPWEDEGAIEAAGALALAFSAEEYAAYRSRWPNLSAPRLLLWPFRAPLGREETMTIYYGFLRPGEK